MEDREYLLTELGEEDKSFLKNKTVASLPDNPSDKRWSAAQIKHKMYDGQLVLFEMLRKSKKETNTLATHIFSKIGDLNTKTEEIANSQSKYDENGNRIIETYATKEELSNIGAEAHIVSVQQPSAENAGKVWIDLDANQEEFADFSEGDNVVEASPNYVFDNGETHDSIIEDETHDYIVEDDNNQ